MKKVFIQLILIFFSIGLMGRDSYIVSGKVLQGDNSVNGVRVTVSVINENNETEENSSGNVTEFVTTSNSAGIFHFNLPSGKYSIECEYTPSHAVPDELFVIGPEVFEVEDKGVENLVFKVVDSLGYIEFNAGLLEKTVNSSSSVNYKWGKLPMFSEEECKVKATSFLNVLKNEEKKDILKGATLGIPLKIYDLGGNPAFYQFPIINLETRIGYIGIHSIGIQPEESNFFSYPRITLSELKERKSEFENKNFLMDNIIPYAKERVASKMGISSGDLIFRKLLSLTPDSFGFYIVFTKFPDEKEIIVDLNDYSIVSEKKTVEELRDESEARYTLEYILDLKSNK